MAFASVSPNYISAEEMAAATDANAPATPERFVPYQKLLASLTEAEQMLQGDLDLLELVAAQLEAIGKVAEGYLCEHLASTGEAVIWDHFSCRTDFIEKLKAVIESAKATMPRKRWDESGSPDDMPDDDDLAREAAAAVVL